MKRTIAFIMFALMALAVPAGVLAEEWQDITIVSEEIYEEVPQYAANETPEITVEVENFNAETIAEDDFQAVNPEASVVENPGTGEIAADNFAYEGSDIMIVAEEQPYEDSQDVIQNDVPEVIATEAPVVVIEEDGSGAGSLDISGGEEFQEIPLYEENLGADTEIPSEMEPEIADGGMGLDLLTEEAETEISIEGIDIVIDSETDDMDEISIESYSASAEGISALNAVASGTCGENLTWVLDEDWTLTISGTGEMTNYRFYSVPWYEYRESVMTVAVEEGVTSIGEYAFYYFKNLGEVTLPSTLKTIGGNAFSNCYNLTYVFIPDGVTVIGEDAFYNSWFSTLRLPQSITDIGYMAFYATKLDEVFYEGSESQWNEIIIGENNTKLINADFTYNVSTVVGKVREPALGMRSNGVVVRWNEAVNAEGYYIYRKTSFDNYTQIAAVDGSTFYYIDTSAQNETEYSYEILAYSGSTLGRASERTITYYSSTVTDVIDPTKESTYNSGKQTYGTYGSPVYSYLVSIDNGFMRVEYANGQIIVEYYDDFFNIISKKIIMCELSKFGGFYDGENAYYLVFGQDNPEENDSVEVFRVVKYSTSWVRLGEVNLYGADTTIPFASGSLRMTEYDGFLNIHTCHQMYTYSDGLKHQSNMTIKVDESSMEGTNPYCDDSVTAYVSHSFNQFILVDDSGGLIMLDHGDAYPRGAILQITQAINAGSVSVFTFQGEIGENVTGASLGGLEYSSSAYLSAGNSVTQDDNWRNHTARNVFVTVTSRNDLSTTVKWITDYDTDGDITASTPQLVKMNSDSFLLLWTTLEYQDISYTYSNVSKLHYVFLDGNGNTTSEIYTVDGQLSDCKPIAVDGSAIWYVTGDAGSNKNSSTPTTPYFYTIDSNGAYSVVSPIEAPAITSIRSTVDGIELHWEQVPGAEEYYIYRSGTEYIENDGSATSYTIPIYNMRSNPLSSGSIYVIWMEAYANGDKSLASGKSFYLYLAPPVVTLSRTDTGIQMSWDAVSGAEGYQIYRRTEGGDYVLMQTTADCSWLDETTVGGTTYTYQVCSYAGDTVSGGSSERSMTYMITPTLVELSNADGGINVTWETVEGAEQYRICYKWSTMSSFTYTAVEAEEKNTQSAILTGYSGRNCEVYVRAVTDDASSPESETKSILYLACPSVTLTQSGNAARLDWRSINGADGYSIFRKQENGNYELVKTTSDTSWTDSDLSDGITYTYQVCAYSGDSQSAGSAEVTYYSPEAPETAKVNISDCTVSLSSVSYTYDGTAKKPAVTVKNGSTTLTSGTDYTVSYSNNTNAGEAAVTVAGQGNYTGTSTVAFTINKASQTVTVEADASSIEVGQTAKITASGKGTIAYSSSDTSVAAVSSSGIVSGIAAGTATITVEADGSENYMSGSTTLNIKVTEASSSGTAATDISSCKLTLSDTVYDYDGTKKKPAVTVKDGSTKLKKGTDYSVSYSNNKKIGTATVTVTGQGNYTGTAEAAFEITVRKGASYTAGDFTVSITKASINGEGKVKITGLADPSLTKAAIPATLKIGGVKFKVTAIASKAFKGCTNLKSASIGSNVTKIGNKAFQGCRNMTKVTIKKSVKTIGNKAFYNCKNLKSVTIKSKVLTSVGTDALKGIKSTAVITVPDSKLSKYKKLLKGKGQGSKVTIVS